MLIYNGGDMLSIASQAMHAQENKELRKLGFDVYSPQDDKSINDKKNQSVESNNSLAEKIFAHDTHGMELSDVIIFEVSNSNVGTDVEIGQWAEHERIHKTGKHYFFQSYDIRRTTIPEVGDRRSWSINQYLYGAVLALNPAGIQPWHEILKELKQLQGGRIVMAETLGYVVKVGECFVSESHALAADASTRYKISDEKSMAHIFEDTHEAKIAASELNGEIFELKPQEYRRPSKVESTNL